MPSTSLLLLSRELRKRNAFFNVFTDEEVDVDGDDGDNDDDEGDDTDDDEGNNVGSVTAGPATSFAVPLLPTLGVPLSKVAPTPAMGPLVGKTTRRASKRSWNLATNARNWSSFNVVNDGVVESVDDGVANAREDTLCIVSPNVDVREDAVDEGTLSTDSCKQICYA